MRPQLHDDSCYGARMKKECDFVMMPLQSVAGRVWLHLPHGDGAGIRNLKVFCVLVPTESSLVLATQRSYASALPY